MRDRPASPGAIELLGFPNWTRTASASVVTGFHSAMVCSIPGIVSVGTKVLAMKVSGKSTPKAMPCTPSGVRTRLPRSTPTQIMANANATSRA